MLDNARMDSLKDKLAKPKETTPVETPKEPKTKGSKKEKTK